MTTPPGDDSPRQRGRGPPQVSPFEYEDVIKRVCTGTLSTSHALAVVALSKVAYFPHHVSVAPGALFLHRMTVDGPPARLPIKGEMISALQFKIQKGVARVCHFKFNEKGGGLVHVYTICGTDYLGDVISDVVGHTVGREMFRRVKKGLSLKNHHKHDEHKGIVSYAGNAYDLIAHNIQHEKKPIARICVYGHSLGGSCSLLVSHRLHQDRAHPGFGSESGLIGSSTRIECNSLSAPSYVTGATEYSYTREDMDEMNGLFTARNFANAGDAVIFRSLFRRFTYPVDFRKGTGDSSFDSSHGVTIWGDLDPEDKANALFTVINGISLGVFNHSSISIDGVMYCDAPSASTARDVVSAVHKLINKPSK